MNFSKPVIMALVFFSLCFIHAAAIEKPDFSLKEDLRIGQEYGEENLMFAGISGVGLDADGNIYILDMKNFRVQLFDASGGFLHSLPLSKGQGPSEINNFAKMAVQPDGTVSLLDFYARKVILFKKTGEFIRSFILDFHAFDIAATEKTLVVLGYNDNRILHELDLEGRCLASFCEPFPPPSRLAAHKEMVNLWRPMRLDRAPSGEIYLLNPFSYKVLVFKDRIHTQTIEGENPFFKPMSISTTGGNRSIVTPSAYILTTQGMVLSTIMEMKGLHDMVGHMDIFKGGKILGTLETKGTPLCVDSQGRIYVSEQEEFPQLVRYSLVSNGSQP